MSAEISQIAKVKLSEPKIETHLILEIDGIDHVFGSYDVMKKARIGDDGLRIGDGWKIGGNYVDPKSIACVSMTGSSKQLSQQLNQEKGGSGSIGSVSIELLDLSGIITKIISEQTEQDILYRDATVYLGLKGLSHPEDSFCILKGVISSIQAKIGSYILTIQHPEIFKKKDIFQSISAVSLTSLTPTSESILIDNDSELIRSTGQMFVRIDDEWIQYTGVEKIGENFSLYGLTRGARQTDAVAHDIDADVSSGVEIEGNLIDLALQVMLSGADDSPEQTLIAINQVSSKLRIQNALLFTYDIKKKLGLVVGDYIRAIRNDGFDLGQFGTIRSFGKSEVGYYVVIDSPVLLATTNAPTWRAVFKSKYNIWDKGCGVNPKYIDIEEHEKLQALYGNSFLYYKFFLDDSVDGQVLVNEQIYFPSGLYQIPRKGMISVGLTRAPIAEGGCVSVNSENIINPEKLIIQRDSTNYFYNSVIYLYNYNNEDDSFYSKHIEYSATSIDKIKIGNKPLEIEAKGIPRSALSKVMVKKCAGRFLKRYHLACEFVEGIELNFKTGFNIDIGDTVLFGDSVLKMSDMKKGSRSFEPRLMEVVNKSLDIKSGRSKVNLLDTNIEEKARYGVVSPSSIVNYSSNTVMNLSKMLTIEKKSEQEKWGNFVGQHVQVRSEDWSRSAVVEILGFNSSNEMIVSPIPFIPQRGDIVTVAPYSSNAKVDRVFKSIYTYVNPTDSIVEVVSANSFRVNHPENFTVGNNVIIHNSEWAIKSNTVPVKSKIENLITVEGLGISLEVGQIIDLIGFADGGAPYLAME